MPEPRATSIISGIIEEVNIYAVNVHRQQRVITGPLETRHQRAGGFPISLPEKRGAEILGIYLASGSNRSWH
jgi:hypothetical protein